MIHAGANLIDGVPVEVIRKRQITYNAELARVPPKPMRLIQSDFTATLFGAKV